MSNELKELLYQAKRWLESSIGDYHYIVTIPLSLIFYTIFPTDSYMIFFCALLFTMIMDTFTKMYALIRIHRAFIGVVKSHTFWTGIGGKLLVLVTMGILTGILYRFSILPEVGNLLGTVVYFVMWSREAISVMENLVEAGHKELDFFKRFLNKKQRQVINTVLKKIK